MRPEPDDLYSRLFARHLFPFLDRVNRTRIVEKIALLDAAETADPERASREQAAKLPAMIRFCERESDFYRELWRTRNGPPSAYPELDGLPVLTKADLTAAGGHFPIPGHDSGVVEVRTSGSTGAPMTFYRSREQESWFWALRFRIWGWSGYSPGDPYLTINLNPRLGWRKRLQDRLFRCSYLTFTSDNQNSGAIVESLRRSRIRYLNGFSSSLYVLSRHMLDRGLENPGVSGVTATGDGLFPAYRESIESAFGVRVLDYYGAGGEGVHLASQCLESGGRYHLFPENAVTEILDRDGPAAPGRPGRIVVTQLDNRAMPLVRYELGDVAVPAAPDVRCACGRTLPMLESVEGRVPDLVAVPGGTFIVPHFFVVLFKNLQEIHRYQVIQRVADEIEVVLVPRPGCARDRVERAVRGAVGEATGDAIRCTFLWVDEIPLSSGGKRRLVISEVSPEPLG
jgi:phenylacetate-CoA ligase